MSSATKAVTFHSTFAVVPQPQEQLRGLGPRAGGCGPPRWVHRDTGGCLAEPGTDLLTLGAFCVRVSALFLNEGRSTSP